MNGRFWTDAELRRLRHFYPHIKTAPIAAMLGRSLQTVYAKARVLGLAKTSEYLASPSACRLRREASMRSVACRFRPGNVPANKGLRRPGYGPGRMRETQFKKGQRGNKWVPLGTEVFNTDGWLVRKMREDLRGAMNWRAVHVILWEEAYGPVPPGYAVKFIDGDRKHVTLSNLCLVNRADLARMNNMWATMPRELAEVIQLRGALKRHINRRLKDEKSYRRSA